MTSSNPALQRMFAPGSITETASGSMTVRGTVNKIGILLICVAATAFLVWEMELSYAVPAAILGAIGGFIVALVTIFKASWARYTAPVYALLEGLFLGGLSRYFNDLVPGLPPLALIFTFCILGVMAIVYRAGIIKATQKFKMAVIGATFGIAVAYGAILVFRLFGMESIALSDMGFIGIGIGLFIVVVAALNLVIDFDMIEQGVAQGAPAHMEWFGAFGILLTLVWLYVEVIRLAWTIATILDS